MSNFGMVVAYLAMYKPNEPITRNRGRPRKVIKDVDLTKLKVIHDKTIPDDLRSEIESEQDSRSNRSKEVSASSG